MSYPLIKAKSDRKYQILTSQTGFKWLKSRFSDTQATDLVGDLFNGQAVLWIFC